MKGKKILAIVLATAMGISLAACGASGSGSTETINTEASESVSSTGAVLENGRYEKITAALPSDPQNLEPKDVNNAGKINFMYQIYEALFDWSDDGSLVPSLGKELNIVDETTYDVTLYDCIYDSAGNHITASDVVYSVNWLVESGNALKYEIFDSVEALDEYTVEFHWASAPSALSDLEFPLTRTLIFSESAWESGEFATAPVATGSYVVSEFVSGSKLILEANDDYWALADESIFRERSDLHHANVQTIEYEVISESSQAAISLEQGTIDFCDYITAAAVTSFEDGGDYADVYNVSTEMGGDFYCLVPNMMSSVMSDLNFRLAVWYAIDSSSVATVMGGSFAPLSAVGTTFFGDYVESWEDEDTYMTVYNLDLAKEYLDKSSYNGETITIVSQSSEAEKNAITMIQTMLAQIGINSEIQASEASIFKTVTAGASGWDIQLTSVGGTTLVGVYNRLYSNTVNTIDGVGYTLSMLDDPELQSLYETANADATHDDEHMTALNDYVIENAYNYALVGQSSSRVYSKKIENLYFREGNAVTLACSEYAGQEISHNSPRIIISKIEGATPSGYTYIAEDGTVYILSVADDGSWTLYVGDETYTGDASFPGDEDDILMTTPPNEGVPASADFYEDSGVCKWRILSDTEMIPLNVE